VTFEILAAMSMNNGVFQDATLVALMVQCEGSAVDTNCHITNVKKMVFHGLWVYTGLSTVSLFYLSPIIFYLLPLFNRIWVDDRAGYINVMVKQAGRQ
jgi:hypothetical protein